MLCWGGLISAAKSLPIGVSTYLPAFSSGNDDTLNLATSRQIRRWRVASNRSVLLVLMVDYFASIPYSATPSIRSSADWPTCLGEIAWAITRVIGSV
jgi:hypothetical protein